MKFLCDVHISYKLAKHIESLGYEAIHVNSILDKWYSKDNDIADYSDKNNFIIISKDSDFRDSYFVKKSPKKLIKINLGNISNTELIDTFTKLLAKLKDIDTDKDFLIEVDKESFKLY
jgi:predicted nuclease of predicted toxin-antitoxin system